MQNVPHPLGIYDLTTDEGKAIIRDYSTLVAFGRHLGYRSNNHILWKFQQTLYCSEGFRRDIMDYVGEKNYYISLRKLRMYRGIDTTEIDARIAQLEKSSASRASQGRVGIA